MKNIKLMLIFYGFMLALIMIVSLASKCAGKEIHYGATWVQNEYLNHLEGAAWNKVGLGDKYHD